MLRQKKRGKIEMNDQINFSMKVQVKADLERKDFNDLIQTK